MTREPSTSPADDLALTGSSKAIRDASRGQAHPLNKHNMELEGLRGLAALMVLYTHLLWPSHELDPGYSPPRSIMLLEASQGAVALFFVISGYVIGLTNTRAWSRRKAGDYLRRRAMRLVPLYVLAVLAAELIAHRDSWGTVIGNLFFLQNAAPICGWRVLPMLANTNLWSLNFEVVYYLVFLLVWRFRPPLLPLMGFSAAIAAVGYFSPIVPVWVSNYACGWVFWLAGLWIARDCEEVDHTDTRIPLASLLLLLVIWWQIKPLFVLVHRYASEPAPFQGAISLASLDYVLVCTVLVATTGRRRLKGSGLLQWVLLGVPLALVAWRMGRGTLPRDEYPLGGLTLLAALLWFWRLSPTLLRKISIAGTLCYGIYIFQRPVQYFVRDWLPLPSGTIVSYALRLALCLAGLFVVAWVAELRLQPWIRGLVKRRAAQKTSAQ